MYSTAGGPETSPGRGIGIDMGKVGGGFVNEIEEKEEYRGAWSWSGGGGGDGGGGPEVKTSTLVGPRHADLSPFSLFPQVCFIIFPSQFPFSFTTKC